jgi:hypothetical protein
MHDHLSTQGRLRRFAEARGWAAWFDKMNSELADTRQAKCTAYDKGEWSRCNRLCGYEAGLLAAKRFARQMQPNDKVSDPAT